MRTEKMDLLVEGVSKRTKSGYDVKQAIDSAIYEVFTADEIKADYDVYFEAMMCVTWATC